MADYRLDLGILGQLGTGWDYTGWEHFTEEPMGNAGEWVASWNNDPDAGGYYYSTPAMTQGGDMGFAAHLNPTHPGDWKEAWGEHGGQGGAEDPTGWYFGGFSDEGDGLYKLHYTTNQDDWLGGGWQSPETSYGEGYTPVTQMPYGNYQIWTEDEGGPPDDAWWGPGFDDVMTGGPGGSGHTFSYDEDWDPDTYGDYGESLQSGLAAAIGRGMMPSAKADYEGETTGDPYGMAGADYGQSEFGEYSMPDRKTINPGAGQFGTRLLTHFGPPDPGSGLTGASGQSGGFFTNFRPLLRPFTSTPGTGAGISDTTGTEV